MKRSACLKLLATLVVFHSTSTSCCVTRSFSNLQATTSNARWSAGAGSTVRRPPAKSSRWSDWWPGSRSTCLAGSKPPPLCMATSGNAVHGPWQQCSLLRCAVPPPDQLRSVKSHSRALAAIQNFISCICRIALYDPKRFTSCVSTRRPVAMQVIRTQGSPKFCCAQKNLFQIYNENKNRAPSKLILTPSKPENLACYMVSQLHAH